MAEPLPILTTVGAGGSVSFRFQLTGPDGLEVTAANGHTAFTDSDTIAAAVWRGDDQATLFAPEAEWITASLATVRISLSETDTAQTPGDYLCQLTAGTTKQLIGRIRITPSPGSGTAPRVYCTYDDMRQRAGAWLDDLMESSDQTGFAEQRAAATAWFDDCLYAKDRGQIATVQGRLASDGSTWPIRGGYARNPWLVTQLEASKLIVTSAIKEAVACYATSLVLLAQMSPKDSEMRDHAALYRAVANELASTIVAELDTDGDDVSDYVIDLRVAG